MMIHANKKMNATTLKMNIQDDAKRSLIALMSFLRNMPNDRDHGARDTSFQRCMADQLFGRFPMLEGFLDLLEMTARNEGATMQ